jgi:hypothetical protein
LRQGRSNALSASVTLSLSAQSFAQPSSLPLCKNKNRVISGFEGDSEVLPRTDGDVADVSLALVHVG